MKTKPTEFQILEQLDLARPRSESGQTHPDNAHSSFEDGVVAALEWVLFPGHDAPIDVED